MADHLANRGASGEFCRVGRWEGFGAGGVDPISRQHDSATESGRARKRPVHELNGSANEDLHGRPRIAVTPSMCLVCRAPLGSAAPSQSMCYDCSAIACGM